MGTLRPAQRPGLSCRGSVVGLCPTVSWLVAVSYPLSRHIQHQCLAHVPCRAMPRVLQPPCAVSQRAKRRIAAPGCTIERHMVAPLSATIQLFYRDPAPNRAPCSPYCTRTLSYRGPTTPCHGPCLDRLTGRLGRVIVESWPIHEHPSAASLPSLSQYSLLYCDLN